MDVTMTGPLVENALANPRLDSALRARIELVRGLIEGNPDTVSVAQMTGDFVMHGLYRELTVKCAGHADGTHMLTFGTSCPLLPDAEIVFGIAEDDGSVVDGLDEMDEGSLSAWVNEDPMVRATLDCTWGPECGASGRDQVSVSAVVAELIRLGAANCCPLGEVADAVDRICGYAYERGVECGLDAGRSCCSD